MGQRQLLNAVKDLRLRAHHGERTAAPDSREDEGRLCRVLPLASARHRFGAVVLLSLCGMLLSLTCYWSMRPSVPLEWVLRYGVLGTLIICPYLALVPHFPIVAFRKDILADPLPVIIMRAYVLVTVPLCALALIVYANMHGFASVTAPNGSIYYRGNEWPAPAPLVLGVLLLWPLFITDFLVPEFIARWRGANLLFPTAWELRRQRLLLVPGAIVLCLLLGWLTAVLARLMLPAG